MSPVDNGLLVEGLEVRFGGLVAVNGLSLEAPIGRITGLIGPNGAGKSTSFDACFGFTRPSAGRVSFAGVDLTHAPVTTRAHLGIGRTFQRIELFDNLSVHHNVALGLEAKLAGRSPLTQLWARRSERQAVEEVTRVATPSPRDTDEVDGDPLTHDEVLDAHQRLSAFSGKLTDLLDG